MNNNQSSINTGSKKKNEAHFKFSLFNATSDVWILAIALLVLLVISFINEKETYPSSTGQIQNSSENNISAKEFSTGINMVLTEDKAGVVREKIAEIKHIKIFLG